jgi:aspartate/methionine/tyrosine aminotransferase
MPGARLGWIVVPQHKIRDAEIVAQNLYISAPTLSQYGALEAFDDEHLKLVRETFLKRRDYLYSELNEIFRVENRPQGAFYIWCDISKYSSNSFDFAKELLDKCHIGVTPGVDFGTNNTNKYLRFAYTRDIEHIKIGIDRIKNYINFGKMD